MNELQRLAEAITRLRDHRKTASELRTKVDKLRGGGFVVVEGEHAGVEQLEALLGEAEAALKSLAVPAADANVADELAAIEEVAKDPRWEQQTKVIDAALAVRHRQDTELRAECEGRLNAQLELLKTLRDVVDEAASILVITRRDEQLLMVLGDFERQARRALAEAQHEQFESSIRKLAECDIAAITNDIRRRIDEGPQHWRQAELLLIRAPKAEQDRIHHYSVILRTISAPGAHGLNVKDEIDMPDQLRRGMLIGANAVERGVRRSQAISRAGATIDARAGAQAAPAPANDTRAVEPSQGEIAEQDLERTARDLGKRLFRQALPQIVKDYLVAESCSITITTNDLELPWELLCDGGDRFVCLEQPVARMPMSSALPRRRRQSLRKKLRFLLVGAAKDLPNVTREIDQIEGALSKEFGDGIDVDRLKPASSDALEAALAGGEHDVIHFAGHAAFDARQPHLSRLELEDGPLLAANINQALTGSPVVFLNACETSTTQNERNFPDGTRPTAAAEGLAMAFIYGGALGCIGNLWPVHDGIAADFAIEFYRQLLDHLTIGKSMLLARHAVRKQYPGRISWAGFVLFGNPLFRLEY